jgi:deoxyhypusine synthase
MKSSGSSKKNAVSLDETVKQIMVLLTEHKTIEQTVVLDVVLQTVAKNRIHDLNQAKDQYHKAEQDLKDMGGLLPEKRIEELFNQIGKKQ